MVIEMKKIGSKVSSSGVENRRGDQSQLRRSRQQKNVARIPFDNFFNPPPIVIGVVGIDAFRHTPGCFGRGRCDFIFCRLGGRGGITQEIHDYRETRSTG